MLTNGEVHFNKTILDGTCPAGGPTTASSDDYKHGTVSNHIRRAQHSEALHTTELQSSGAVLFVLARHRRVPTQPSVSTRAKGNPLPS